MVQQNGGSVFVNSEPGLGSQFSIYLPITEPPVAPRTEPPPPLREAPPAPLRATILLAEDEPTLRTVIRRTLARSGHTVLAAEDGESALRAAAAHPEIIDLLITDFVMPKVNGAELARRLTTERPGIRVLFISGYSWGEVLPPAILPSASLICKSRSIPKPWRLQSPSS